jgi:hypothetical protein
MCSQPPHSGYHWDGITPRFFEGWYFRVMIPPLADGFAFMYSIQDPRGGQVNSGGAVQIFSHRISLSLSHFSRYGSILGKSSGISHYPLGKN